MFKYIPNTPNIAFRNITYNYLHNTSHHIQHYQRMMKHVIFLLIDFLIQWNSLYLRFWHQNTVTGSLHCSCDGSEHCRHESRSIRSCNYGTWNRQMPCIRWIRLWIWKDEFQDKFQVALRKVKDWIENHRGDVSLWFVVHMSGSMWSWMKVWLVAWKTHNVCLRGNDAWLNCCSGLEFYRARRRDRTQ